MLLFSVLFGEFNVIELLIVGCANQATWRRPLGFMFTLWWTFPFFLSGETGLLVGRITQRSPFVGYAGNQHQTEKKRLRDVLKKGDLYFNTGDLLWFDNENFVYFQDRVGDTFRQVVTLGVDLSVLFFSFLQRMMPLNQFWLKWIYALKNIKKIY